MDRKTKFKEAVKVALAFALVYGIALRVNWLSPGWAGFSVVAIAVPSAGQSIHKGLLRMAGTIPGCLSALIIIALVAQDRWLFMILTAGWLFFATYMMLADKPRSYFWFVAGYVCLVISAAGPSPVGAFKFAVYRTMETALGIAVYTLISVFIWPRTNAGAIKKAGSAMLATQAKLIQFAYNMLTGTAQMGPLLELRQQEVKQMGQFSQSLQAEGSESYQVQEIRPLWDQFERTNMRLMKTIDRLFAGIDDLSKVDIHQLIPDLDGFIIEINDRFDKTVNSLSGNKPSSQIKDVKASVNIEATTNISHLDKAALAIIIDELDKIQADSRGLLSLALDITDFQKESKKLGKDITKHQQITGLGIHVPDLEYLKGALYVASTVIVGFLIWFFVNPPGHVGWYALGGTMALIFASAQQVRITKLIIPFIVGLVFMSLIYLFVLPKLTSFYQLGILMFVCMFIVQFYLSGAGTAVFTIAIIEILVITNPQQYNLTGLANAFIYVVMLLVFLFGMSYILNSPRPEKTLLHLVSRFFKSAKYLLSNHTIDTSTSTSFIQRYKAAFYLHELRSLPGKINIWGKIINKNLFPDTDYHQIEEMVNDLQMLVIRIEVLMDANRISQENELTDVLMENIIAWKQRLEKAFDNWNNLPHEIIKKNNSEVVGSWMASLEDKLENIIAQNKNKVDEGDGIRFYRLLGGYRGVTEATLSFVNSAEKIDWVQWKEERFE